MVTISSQFVLVVESFYFAFVAILNLFCSPQQHSSQRIYWSISKVIPLELTFLLVRDYGSHMNGRRSDNLTTVLYHISTDQHYTENLCLHMINRKLI